MEDRMPLVPDACVAIVAVLALALEFLRPLSLLPPPAWAGWTTLAGGALILAGLATEIAAARQLSQSATTPQPNGAPSALVTGGIYSRSRNPFYCGLLIVVTGAMLALSLDWLVICVPLLWLALDRLVISVEERRLERAFGAAYLKYAHATRRWI
jgi:protein-S-isoprenylcysteine O-methyltransferase Ste14